MGCWERFREKTNMKQSTLDKITKFLAEVIGTGILVYLGCMGCVSNSNFPNSGFYMCFNFGLVVMLVIQCFGCVSGAHLNPAVSLAAFIYKMLTPSMFAVYISGQMLGAFIGYGLLKLSLPTTALVGAPEGLCVTIPRDDVTIFQSCLIEFIITSILVWVCCAVWDPRNAKWGDSIPLRFGLAISCLAFTAGPYTGASMNPARSFGPALWNNNFRLHYVYWVGPMAAAVVATYVYKIVFRREVEAPARNSKLREMEEVPLS